MDFVMYVPDAEMDSWKQICKAYADKVGADLLFVNNTSCGLAWDDGRLQHLYIDEMTEILKQED